MNHEIHRADSRGFAQHGWLSSYHSFSFGNYHNPERMQFGVLRVLNDDEVEAGMGFRTHTHRNMEIISIPLEGDLEHKDSMGNLAVIREGDIQVMSAGSGISHSEFNRNRDKKVKFLQIWVLPNQLNVPPRYDQISLDKAQLHNQLYQVLSPNKDDSGVWVHQEAWFHLGDFDEGVQFEYRLKQPDNGLYVFIIEGSCTVDDVLLEPRDGIGIKTKEVIPFEARQKTRILLMEVPMSN